MDCELLLFCHFLLDPGLEWLIECHAAIPCHTSSCGGFILLAAPAKQKDPSGTVQGFGKKHGTSLRFDGILSKQDTKYTAGSNTKEL